MIPIQTLVRVWAGRGIALTVDGDKLLSRAKPGAIDTDTAAIIRARKQEIVAFLQGAGSGPTVEDVHAFWRAEANSLPVVHGIALDGARPPLKSAHMVAVAQQVDAILVASLRALAARHEADFACLLRCALAITVAYWSRCDDVVVGIGRDASAGPLPLLLAVRPEDTLVELLRGCRARSAAVLTHGALTRDELADLLHVERSPAYAALCQIVLWGPDVIDPGDVSPFDLCVLASEDGAALTWHADAALFGAARLARIMDGFLQVLRQMALNPDLPAGGLQLTTGHDLQRQQTWNETATPYPATLCLHTLIERQAARTPARTALVSGETALSYADVNAKANALAVDLATAGVRPGDIVAVVMRPGLEVPLAFLAAMKAGAAFAPLDCNWPAPRLQAVLARLGAAIVLLNDGLAAPLASLPAHMVHWQTLGSAPDAGLALSSAQPIYVMHTSGSTGVPKGALNSHRGIVNRLCFMSRYFGDGPDEVVLQTTHHCFDSAVWQLFWPLTKGGCSVLPSLGENVELANILSLMMLHGVTLSDFSPALLNLFADHVAAAPAMPAPWRLRHLVVGGEAITPAIAANCARALPGVGLHNFYGVSEASIGCIHWRIPQVLEGSVPIGRPIDNVVVLIADPRLRPMPVGAPGEILLGGDCVGIGYVGLAEMTRRAFVELDEPVFGCRRWYRTGDLGRYRENGDLEFLGRIDEQVKLRGFRIELGEVRAALEAVPGVRMAHVQVNGEGEQRHLAAYVVAPSSADREEFIAAARAALAKLVPGYMLPGAWYLLDAIPLSPGGKVDRRALPIEVAANRPARVAPAGHLERELTAIWADLLNVPANTISAADSFFEIGGHSLLCIAVQAAIRKRLGMEVAVADLFLYPTIGHLSRFLGAGVEAGPTRALALDGAKERLRRAQANKRPARGVAVPNSEETTS